MATDDHGTTLPYRLLVASMLVALLGGGDADMASTEGPPGAAAPTG